MSSFKKKIKENKNNKRKKKEKEKETNNCDGCYKQTTANKQLQLRQSRCSSNTNQTLIVGWLRQKNGMLNYLTLAREDQIYREDQKKLLY